jgi:small GTP-binding protein
MSFRKNDDSRLKLYVIGDGGVGKTTLIHKFITGIFHEDTRITIGVDYHFKTIHLEGIGNVDLHVWDHGGVERFRFMLPEYIKGARGIMFVFSVTNMNTLTSFDNWLSYIRQYDPNIPILLVGAKIDLENIREVQHEEAQEISTYFGCKGYIEVSSKEDINVEEAFASIAKHMWDYTHKK